MHKNSRALAEKTAIRLALASAGLVLGFERIADGATNYYWTGGSAGVGQAWTTPANWSATDGVYSSSGPKLPSSGSDVAVIDSSTASSGLVASDLGVSASFSLNSIVFGQGLPTPYEYIDDSTSVSNTTAFTLTLNGDGTASDDLITLNNSNTSEVDFRGDETLGSLSGSNPELLTMTIGGTGNLDAVNATNYIRIDAPITSTAASLGKDGNGTVTLAGANTFAAGSTFTSSAGTLNLPGTNTFTTTSASTFNVTGGTVNLSGSTMNFGTGSNMNISGGEVIVAGSANIGSAGSLTINIGSGTFSWQGTTAVALNSARLFTLTSPTSTIDVISGGSLSIPSAITGGGDLTKTSAGTLVIENTGNSFGGGAVNVNGGVLVFNNPSDLGANATAAAPTAININAGTLQFAGAFFTIANNLPISMNSSSSAIDVIGGSTLTITNTVNYTNSISGSGVLNKVDSGDLVVNVPTSVTAINVAGGTLTIGNASALGTVPSTASTDVTLASSTTLDFTVGLAMNSKRLVVIGPSSGSGNSTIEVDNGTGFINYTTIPGAISNNGSGTGGLYKTGTGDLFLNGANTYSGPTNINLGLLSGNGSLQSVVNVNAGGAVSAGSTAVVNSVTTLTIGALTSTGQVWNGGGAYAWKLDLSNPGTPGATSNSGAAGTNWDNLSMGTLSIAANSASTFTIHLIGINAGSSTFDPTQNYIWNIANTTASGGTGNITGFDPSDFVLDTSSFGVATNGNFTIGEVPDGQGEDLSISYTPTPEPAMSSVALLASALMLRRRRRSAAGGARE